MSHHISRDLKARKCGAASPQTCPLKNSTEEFIKETIMMGGEIDKKLLNPRNHYVNAEEAQEAVDAILEARNPMKSKKKPPSQAFIKNRELLKDSLIKYGNVDEKDISEVANIREMVKEWFGGDRNAYTTFKYIAESETIDDNTRKKIAEMVNGNFKVTTINNVSNIGSKKDTKSSQINQSEITIIDEVSDKITLEDLRNGNVSPFIK